jgi:hypothetical protein
MLDATTLETAWQGILEANALHQDHMSKISKIRATRDQSYEAPASGDWEVLELLFDAEIKRLGMEAKLALATARTVLFRAISDRYGWGTKIRREASGYTLPELGIKFHYEEGITGEEKEEACDAPSYFCAC